MFVNLQEITQPAPTELLRKQNTDESSSVDVASKFFLYVVARYKSLADVQPLDIYVYVVKKFLINK